ncbi:condensation domain-containing protein, partial [Caballeronia sp. dw_276]|uniref:condensation domain-containing protein n=1 Tax=Caballeronia sp. dw_276 TaxID=2719795 RepID=UPI001BD653D1
LAALPLTPNGKLDRAALPAPDTSNATTGYVEPHTDTQKTLAGIWRAVLKLDRVGAYDHFFDLGGHSLLATQVLSRLRETLGIELPLRSIFEAPLLADFAARLTGEPSHEPDALPLITPAGRDQPLPLSYAQQRLWFLDQLDPGSAFYNIPIAVRLRGTLDIDALHRALNEVVHRHEALRTRFVSADGMAAQTVSARLAIDLPVTDWSISTSARQTGALHVALTEEAAAPFDLSAGPLIRSRLFRLSADHHVVALTLHHIVSDGWSIGVLVREMAALYNAFSHGEASALAELPVQYADFAHWQRKWLAGEVLTRQLAYWEAQLFDAPALLTLPTDRPRPTMQRHNGAVHRFEIDAVTTAGLHQLARQAQGT